MDTNELLQKIDGMALEDARNLVEQHGFIIRLSMIDGHPMILTRDYRTDRICVSVMNDVIDKVYGIG